MNEADTQPQTANRSVLETLNDQWLMVSFVFIVMVPAALVAMASVFLVFF